jgi:hypothetical protein
LLWLPSLSLSASLAQSQNSLFQSNNALDGNFFTTKGMPTEPALQGIDYLVTQLLSGLFDPQPTYINGVQVNTGIAPVPLAAGGGVVAGE